jgi:hypothetical protein
MGVEGQAACGGMGCVLSWCADRSGCNGRVASPARLWKS